MKFRLIDQTRMFHDMQNVYHDWSMLHKKVNAFIDNSSHGKERDDRTQ